MMVWPFTRDTTEEDEHTARVQGAVSESREGTLAGYVYSLKAALRDSDLDIHQYNDLIEVSMGVNSLLLELGRRRVILDLADNLELVATRNNTPKIRHIRED